MTGKSEKKFFKKSSVAEKHVRTAGVPRGSKNFPKTAGVPRGLLFLDNWCAQRVKNFQVTCLFVTFCFYRHNVANKFE